jgi:hypothetical protein
MKRSGVNALSNTELRELATRMQLEQQVVDLNKRRPKTPGQKLTQELLKDPEKTIKTGSKIARKLATGV